MKVVLTIAGSDCSGGAGIQADLKTIAAHGLYGESAITALTAQNTMGVSEVVPVSPDFLEQQLECIFTDIVPDAGNRNPANGGNQKVPAAVPPRPCGDGYSHGFHQR